MRGSHPYPREVAFRQTGFAERGSQTWQRADAGLANGPCRCGTPWPVRERLHQFIHMFHAARNTDADSRAVRAC